MSARKKTTRGPCFQMYADRALGSGSLNRLSWAQQGMFYWVLNRAWIDGGIPKDARVLSRMMPGGPKAAELAPVLALFTVEVDGGEVTHAMHIEQQTRHEELSKKKSAAANRRWENHAPGDAPSDAPAYAPASSVHQKSDANGMPSQPLNLPIGYTTSLETSSLSTGGGGASAGKDGLNDWERRELAAAPVSGWGEALRAVWLRWLRHLTEVRRGRPSTETLRKHFATLCELGSDEVRIRWLETAIERGLWAPAEPRNGAKKTEVGKHQQQPLKEEDHAKGFFGGK